MLLDRPSAPLQGLAAMLATPLAGRVHATCDAAPSAAAVAAHASVTLCGDLESRLPGATEVRYAWRVTRLEEAPGCAERVTFAGARSLQAPQGRRSATLAALAPDDLFARPLLRPLSRSQSHVVSAGRGGAAPDAPPWSPRAHAAAQRLGDLLALRSDSPTAASLDAAFLPNGTLGGHLVLDACCAASDAAPASGSVRGAEAAAPPGACVHLCGVFTREGLFEARLEVEAAWDAASGAELAPDDFASPGVLVLRVCA